MDTTVYASLSARGGVPRFCRGGGQGTYSVEHVDDRNRHQYRRMGFGEEEATFSAARLADRCFRGLGRDQRA